VRTAVLAGAIGLAATLAAVSTHSLAGSGASALEWAMYDRWAPARTRAPSSPALVVVIRDATSEARLGAGPWDRAVIARLATSLSRAGAAVVGVDVALGTPSDPGRGGASSDALLSQATALSGRVVFPIAFELADAHTPTWSPPPAAFGHRSWPVLPEASPEFPVARPLAGSLPGLAQHARSIGHTLAPAGPDGVVRRVPLFVRLGDRGVPAYGLALAAAAANVQPDQITIDRRHVAVPQPGTLPLRIPVDERGRVLLARASPELPDSVKVVPFGEIWPAIEERQVESLRGLVGDRIVLLSLSERAPGKPDVLVQARLLNLLLTRSWLREVPAAWTVLGTIVLGGLGAWLWLAFRWWKALITSVALALGSAAVLLLAPSLTGVLLPLGTPLVAMILSSAGALGWKHLASGHRVRHLEREVAAIREALVRQESSVEGLEEDLEAAREAVARSTGVEEALRAQLATARAQEEQTRARLEGLATLHPRPLDDAEGKRLQRECEQMGIVTRDPALLAAFRDLEKAARSSLPILLSGEPGTGKELFARAAHRLSQRAGGPFVAVNMAAVPGELFESELFGHVRGSFTGAVADRKGLFEQANRGTLFLDEVGELRPEHQSKLLRVLQDKTFYRVGAARPTTADVRVIAASNRDLERGIAEGWFREDLYFRLKGLVVHLPPLRERRPDIPLLAARFLQEAAIELGRPHPTLSDAALAALELSDWPGNARQLQNCLRQALALADGAIITAEDLRLPTREPVRDDSGSDQAVLASLRQHGFDMQATARALGWDRSTVTQRLKGLGFRALVEAEGDRARAAQSLAGDQALGRTVELKLREYYEHLLRAVEGFDSPDNAIIACRRRFKNLPDRHFRFLELLVRQHFDRRSVRGSNPDAAGMRGFPASG
jgi:DNA-binding NtrC family response regulator